MRVLICGARAWYDMDRMNIALTRLFEELQPSECITGGARGADQLANAWVAENYPLVRREVMNADWNRYGKSAGFRRNEAMLDTNPDVVIAFIEGEARGTMHTVRTAQDRKIKTILIMREGHDAP
jgi:hypothetical protein